MNEIINVTGDILTIKEILIIIFYFLVNVVVVVGFIFFIYRKERRLFKNIKKKIIFLNLTNDNSALEVEENILKKSKFFKAPEKVSNPEAINALSLQNYSLIVLAINEETDSSSFKEVYEKIVSHKKPVIIYTLGNRNVPFLHSETYIKDYYQHTIATTPIRLTGDIFTVLSTFNID